MGLNEYPLFGDRDDALGRSELHATWCAILDGGECDCVDEEPE